MAAGDWKAMLTAIENNELDFVKYYIKEGVNPNYQHPELLTTPLIESIAFGRYEIAKYLLEVGADPELKAGFSQDSPLKMAKKSGNKELIRLIKNYLPQKRSLWRSLFS